MIKDNQVTLNNFPEDWQHYHFGKVVFKHDIMDHETISSEIAKNWDKLYNKITLKKKFIRTLKQTKSPIAGIWSYGSNLQYYNLVFEHDESRPILNLTDIFGLKDVESNPFI